MKAEQKRRAILQYAKHNRNQITKKEAVEFLKHCYYSNAESHIGAVLSTLVRQGHLTRIKPGVFELGGKVQKSGSDNIDKNQLTLEL